MTALPGCSGGVFLSKDGPYRAAVFSGASIRVQDAGPAGHLSYALIGLSPNVVDKLQSLETQPLFHSFVSGGPPATVRIGVGDVLSMTVFESAAGGLFTPADNSNRNGNSVTLPPQQVDQAGNISVPYGGTLHAAGLTAIELQNAIQNRLANRALEPQVVISVVEQHANIVSVFGDVTSSVRFPMDPGGERLLGAIARAGGPKFPAYETYVTIQRHGRTDRALLSAIGENPAQNLQLQPGDAVYVAREPRYFLTLGATGIGQSIGLLNKRISFEDTRLSMADALAKVGGLEDDRANPNAVFLYRMEPKATVVDILGTQAPADLPDRVPTVYTVDMTRGDSFFLESMLQVHSEDIIFASNSPAADLLKVLNLLVPLTGSITNSRSGFD